MSKSKEYKSRASVNAIVEHKPEDSDFFFNQTRVPSARSLKDKDEVKKVKSLEKSYQDRMDEKALSWLDNL